MFTIAYNYVEWDKFASRAIGLFDFIFSLSFCLNVNVKQFLHKHTQVCIQKKKNKQQKTLRQVQRKKW